MNTSLISKFLKQGRAAQDAVDKIVEDYADKGVEAAQPQHVSFSELVSSQVKAVEAEKHEESRKLAEAAIRREESFEDREALIREWLSLDGSYNLVTTNFSFDIESGQPLKFSVAQTGKDCEFLAVEGYTVSQFFEEENECVWSNPPTYALIIDGERCETSEQARLTLAKALARKIYQLEEGRRRAARKKDSVPDFDDLPF